MSSFLLSPDEKLFFVIFHLFLNNFISTSLLQRLHSLRAGFCILDTFSPVVWLQLALLFGKQFQNCDILRDGCCGGSGVMN